MKPLITIHLDKRRIKENGTYPLKIRVYFNGSAKLFPVSIAKSTLPDELTEADYNNAMKAKPKGEEAKKLKQNMASVIGSINTDHFSFETFEKSFKLPKGDKADIFYNYRLKIAKLREAGQIGSAVAYDASMKSLQKYCVKKRLKGKKITSDLLQELCDKEVLKFTEVDKEWLEKYEETCGLSKTSVGMHLRALRAVFNSVNIPHYPFQRKVDDGGYIIPKGAGNKRALTEDDLKVLMFHPTEDLLIKEAKSYWFLSYALNGCNIADILSWKYSNIQGDYIIWVREKTKRKPKKIKARLNPFCKMVIKKYGNPKGPDNFIFPVYENGMNPEQKYKRKINFTRRINDHMGRLVYEINVDRINNNIEPLPKIGTYGARHSWASIALDKGAKIKDISELLGHSNLLTTESYLANISVQRHTELSELTTSWMN